MTSRIAMRRRRLMLRTGSRPCDRIRGSRTRGQPEPGPLDRTVAREADDRVPRLTNDLGDLQLIPKIDEKRAVEPVDQFLGLTSAQEQHVQALALRLLAQVEAACAPETCVIHEVDRGEALRQLAPPQPVGHPERVDPRGVALRPPMGDEDERSRSVIDAALGGREQGAASVVIGDRSTPQWTAVVQNVSTIEPR